MMSLGEILFIYRARLRQRSVAVQELLAVLGIAVGVALLFASQVASTSLDGSVRQLSKQLVGTMQYQLDARGPEGFSERVVGEARSLPGVRAALPLLEQEASVIGPAGRAPVDLIGADQRFASIGGPLLRRFGTRQLAFQQVIALGAPLLEPATLERAGRGAVAQSTRKHRPIELPDRRPRRQNNPRGHIAGSGRRRARSQPGRACARRLCPASRRDGGTGDPCVCAGAARASDRGPEEPRKARRGAASEPRAR